MDGPVTGQWTIRGMVEWMARDFSSRGLASPRLDAELLVAHTLGLDRVGLYLDLDRPLADPELDRLRALVGRRRKHEPVAYILGRREFWGRSFEVGPAVLVPRPETETLVERALELLEDDATGPLLDLCTGSGAIALTLLAERPALRADATDISADALEVAARNAEALGVADRVRLLEGDLFAPLPAESRYRLAVCNPPYVAEADLETLARDIVDHEPRVALVAGADGLAVVRRLAGEARARLEPGGVLLVEVGAGQAGAVTELLGAGGLEDASVHRDLGGVDRVVEARRLS